MQFAEESRGSLPAGEVLTRDKGSQGLLLKVRWVLMGPNGRLGHVAGVRAVLARPKQNC